VLNAQKSGYSAVIVFNYEDSLLRMNSDNGKFSTCTFYLHCVYCTYTSSEYYTWCKYML